MLGSGRVHQRDETGEDGSIRPDGGRWIAAAVPAHCERERVRGKSEMGAAGAARLARVQMSKAQERKWGSGERGRGFGRCGLLRERKGAVGDEEEADGWALPGSH